MNAGHYLIYIGLVWNVMAHITPKPMSSDWWMILFIMGLVGMLFAIGQLLIFIEKDLAQ